MNEPEVRSETRFSRPLPLSPAPPAASPRVDIDRIRDILPDLIDALDDAVVVVDRDRRVLAANRRFVEAFGTTRDDVAGRPCQQGLRCPEMEEGETGPCLACRVIEGGGPARRVRDMVDARGVRRRWEATFSPILDAAGVVSHVVEVWRDISERSKLQAQLSHSERLATTGLLAAGVGHEINNPLASILAGIESLGGLVQRAGLKSDEREEARELLDLLEHEVERCRETTAKLMLLAQPVSQAAAWVDLNAAVRDTLSLLAFQMRQQGIQAEMQLDLELPPLWGRESGIRGLCMNLVINAVQAMPAGGAVTVTTARGGRGALLQVSDTGPGVPDELKDRIWDPFFTTKPVGHGTGLGLSITHSVVTRHGGTIHVEDAPAGGACFVVDLPLGGPGGM